MIDPDLRQSERGDAANVAERLEADGVKWVCTSMVDMGGVTRVKCMPLGKLACAAGAGTGAPESWIAAQSNGEFALPESSGGSVGDMRLMPDLDAIGILAATPGWAWVPADQYTQEGRAHPACQRSFLKRMVERVADAGLDAAMAFEFEWFTARQSSPLEPYHDGPSFSANALARSLSLTEEVLSALDLQGMPVERFHPECSPGQFEVSLSPAIRCERLMGTSSFATPCGPFASDSACVRPSRRSPGTKGWATAATCTSACVTGLAATSSTVTVGLKA